MSMKLGQSCETGFLLGQCGVEIVEVASKAQKLQEANGRG